MFTLLQVPSDNAAMCASSPLDTSFLFLIYTLFQKEEEWQTDLESSAEIAALFV